MIDANEKAPDGVDYRLARRKVFGGILGAFTTAIAPSFIVNAQPDWPPPFGTSRHQFTILRPATIVPPARLTRVDGAAVDFASFRGRVVLVNFWATWCAACRTELPILDRLQEATGHKNLEVVAISVDRNGRSTIAPFLRQLNIRHLGIYLDPDNRIGGTDDNNTNAPFQIYGMPITYIIGAAGQIEGYMIGEADWSSGEAGNLLRYYSQSR